MYNKGKNTQYEKANYGIKKFFANHISNKGLLSIIYKELIPLKSKQKAKNPYKIWLLKRFKEPEKVFSQKHTGGQ